MGGDGLAAAAAEPSFAAAGGDAGGVPCAAFLRARRAADLLTAPVGAAAAVLAGRLTEQLKQQEREDQLPRYPHSTQSQVASLVFFAGGLPPPAFRHDVRPP